jgi:predicted DCC family thiol-disulfide oxidoreductase YuxK
VSEAEAQRKAWWIESDGRRSGGHRAVARALLACRGGWPLLGRLLLLPPVSWLAVPGYALVARYRRHLPGVKPACKRKSWQVEREPADP